MTRRPPERRGPVDRDSASTIRAVGWGIVPGALLSLPAFAAGGVAAAVPTFVFGTWLISRLLLWIAGGGAGIIKHILLPSGRATPYQEGFSVIESHITRGDHGAAAELWEAAIAERPGDVEVRMRAADFYALQGGNAQRALELWLEARGLPALDAARELYVTQRIIDLYVGPLGEKARALVELRRLVDRFPGTAAARHAQEAMREIRAEVHGEG